MNLFRILGAVGFVVGLALLIFGISATQKTGEKIVDEVTGHYTDSTMWYIIGGIGLMVAGAGVSRIKR